VLREFTRDLDAIKTDGGDRVLAVPQVAHDFGGDDYVEDVDQPIDVDGVSLRDGARLPRGCGHLRGSAQYRSRIGGWLLR
jgi:hypothetical protein